jgi:hypothetical protein
MILTLLHIHTPVYCVLNGILLQCIDCVLYALPLDDPQLCKSVGKAVGGGVLRSLPPMAESEGPESILTQNGNRQNIEHSNQLP